MPMTLDIVKMELPKKGREHPYGGDLDDEDAMPASVTDSRSPNL